ncbi:MAG: succinylglutamate desuccinylase/aspartoacylase family protein [Bdellovibrionales bacterium]
MKKKTNLKPIIIDGHEILPGERKRFHIGQSNTFDFTDTGIPVEVIRGTKPGPTLFISAVIHGDELNGFEIIRKILKRQELKDLKGTLIAVPIVNVFGFNTMSRYLPDRRDLNRAFPGSKTSSLASRIADLLMTEIVKKADYGIDLHTGAIHRDNLPQIRACLDDERTEKLAKSFGAPLILNSKLRDGSLREAARKKNIPMLLFEGGEALRFDEDAIRIGVRGCMNVMKDLKMIELKKAVKPKKKCYLAQSSHWVRAPQGGCVRLKKKLGQSISEGDLLGVVSGPFDQEKIKFHSRTTGVVIGISKVPLVNKGDAVIHIATPDKYTPKEGIDYLDG